MLLVPPILPPHPRTGRPLYQQATDDHLIPLQPIKHTISSHLSLTIHVHVCSSSSHASLTEVFQQIREWMEAILSLLHDLHFYHISSYPTYL